VSVTSATRTHGAGPGGEELPGARGSKLVLDPGEHDLDRQAFRPLPHDAGHGGSQVLSDEPRTNTTPLRGSGSDKNRRAASRALSYSAGCASDEKVVHSRWGTCTRGVFGRK
jgi:hypothetical protein